MAALTPEQKKKAAETRRNNRLAAERRQRNRRTLWTVLGIVALVLFGFLIWRTFQSYTPATQTAEPTPAATAEAPTAAPTVAPTEALTAAPTEPPVVATEAPVTPIVACETIEVSKDGGLTWENAGLSLETESVYDIGNRVTWTSRSSLVDKAPDEKLTDAELKIVENTWLKVRLNACNTNVVVFTHGIKIDDLKFDKGALFELGGGYQEFDIRNGEVILWFDQVHQDKDMIRIIDQIRHGNFDIKSRLGLAVTDSLKDKLPDDILVGVQIVLLPK